MPCHALLAADLPDCEQTCQPRPAWPPHPLRRPTQPGKKARETGPEPEYLPAGGMRKLTMFVLSGYVGCSCEGLAEVRAPERPTGHGRQRSPGSRDDTRERRTCVVLPPTTPSPPNQKGLRTDDVALRARPQREATGNLVSIPVVTSSSRRHRRPSQGPSHALPGLTTTTPLQRPYPRASRSRREAGLCGTGQ